jgi:hypothetical protein
VATAPCIEPPELAQGDRLGRTGGSPAGGCVWHVLGLQRSVREWAMRQGWGGRPINEKHAQGILIAALCCFGAGSKNPDRRVATQRVQFTHSAYPSVVAVKIEGGLFVT